MEESYIQMAETEPQKLPKKYRYLKPSYIFNATAGGLLLLNLAELTIVVCMTPAITFLFTLFVDTPGSMQQHPLYQTALNVLLLIGTVAGSIFTISFVKGRLKIELPTYKKSTASMKRVFYYAAIGMGITTVASLLLAVIQAFVIKQELYTPDFSLNFDFMNNFIMFVSTCFVAPVFEELLFRGVILTALKRFGYMFAIIITSILFALAHGNLPQSLPVFFLSLVLCYVTLRYNSLLPAMLIHFINNFTANIESFISRIPYGSIVVWIFEISIMLFAIIVLFKKRKSIKAYIRKHRGKSILSYFPHIFPILYVLCMVGLIIYYILSSFMLL